jgi:hypothetical protein
MIATDYPIRAIIGRGWCGFRLLHDGYPGWGDTPGLWLIRHSQRLHQLDRRDRWRILVPTRGPLLLNRWEKLFPSLPIINRTILRESGR